MATYVVEHVVWLVDAMLRSARYGTVTVNPEDLAELTEADSRIAWDVPCRALGRVRHVGFRVVGQLAHIVDQETYPVADRLTAQDRALLGISSANYMARGVFAVATGEYRLPQAGEWYLSGAIVEAYRAPNDLTCAYHICRLVLCRSVSVQLEVTPLAEAQAPA